MRRIDTLQPGQSLSAGSGEQTTSGLLGRVSVIVPVGPGDTSWRLLLRDLSPLAAEAELLFIAVEPEPPDLAATFADAGLPCRVRWCVAPPDRARQMNFGAAQSTRPFLWFLHADSRIDRGALAALEASLATEPHALHYFDLEFQNDGPAAARWNALGARFRSRFLRLPFGDQGFCMSRETFYTLGGFHEDAAYGEDHLLVWAAHRRRVPLRPVGAPIATSARKYRSRGWLRVTTQNLWRTGRQAIPELAKFLWTRCR